MLDKLPIRKQIAVNLRRHEAMGRILIGTHQLLNERIRHIEGLAVHNRQLPDAPILIRRFQYTANFAGLKSLAGAKSCSSWGNQATHTFGELAETALILRAAVTSSAASKRKLLRCGGVSHNAVKHSESRITEFPLSYQFQHALPVLLR